MSIKVWVGVWSSKHGDDVCVAPTKDKAQRYFADRCCNHYWTYLHNRLADPICDAEFVLSKDDPGPQRSIRVFEAWKKYGDIDSNFAFYAREVLP